MHTISLPFCIYIIPRYRKNINIFIVIFCFYFSDKGNFSFILALGIPPEIREALFTAVIFREQQKETPLVGAEFLFYLFILP